MAAEGCRNFEEVFIQPAAGDAGGALGAALAAHYIYFGQERIIDSSKMDAMAGSYLGPSYSDKEIEQMAKQHQAVFTYHADFANVSAQTAELISQGNVIGWFQGRMEFGPRALVEKYFRGS